jgi:glycosyltransferase involved in cell wall biosynthesis
MIQGRPLRIGIDAHVLGKKKGGVETFIRGLIDGLAKIDSDNTYFLYVGAGHGLETAALPSRFKLRILPFSSPWIQRPLLGAYYRRDALDVIHVQRALPPWGCPNHILHVHDVSYRTAPQLFSSLGHRLREQVFAASAARATCILTVSDASRRDIIHHYQKKFETVHVVPGGIDHARFYVDRSAASLQRLQSEHGFGANYVLSVGAIERNKNLHGLLESFAAVVPGRTPPLYLVIVGVARDASGQAYAAELRSRMHGLNIAERVVFTGYVDQPALRQLMSGARMLVFPSLCEGFGLPPLEAMACGAPVVASRLPAIEEVCGTSALLVDSSDPGHLTLAVQQLLDRPDLVRCLIRRGFERARQFCWERTATAILALYKRVAGSGEAQQ